MIEAPLPYPELAVFDEHRFQRVSGTLQISENIIKKQMKDAEINSA